MSLRLKLGERRGNRGFVLVEVLVAASVAAVLLTAVMRIFASTWSGITMVRDEATAMLVARNVIEASAPRNDLAAGTQEGSSGRYSWTVTIAQLNGQVANTDNAPALAPTPQNANLGQGTNNGGDPNNTSSNGANNGPPWSLFRIVVAVRAPNGRRTDIETYRLSRPSQH